MTTDIITEIPFDIEAAGPITIGFYLWMVEKNSQSPAMAEMLALRQAPSVLTDDVMMGGIGNLDQQFKDPMQLDYITRKAMQHGYKPRHTDFYCGAIAAFPGDPKAFLNHGQGRGDMRKTLEERGWAGEGLVNIKAREPESDPHEQKHKLNPKIVERIRKQKLKENPELKRKDQNEIRAEIVVDHGHNKNR